MLKHNGPTSSLTSALRLLRRRRHRWWSRAAAEREALGAHTTNTVTSNCTFLALQPKDMALHVVNFKAPWRSAGWRQGELLQGMRKAPHRLCAIRGGVPNAKLHP